MAAPKRPVRDWQLSPRRTREIRESGKSADQRKPLIERESVARALMRLPEHARESYLRSLGMIVPKRGVIGAPKVGEGKAILDLLHRVEGKALSHTDAPAIRRAQVREERSVKVRRRKKVAT